MVTGATGLIGSALTARLISAGHIVFGVARTVKEAARRFPAAQWKTCDIARMTQSGLWVPYLEGVDAVVNCAGVLQDGPGDSTRGIHVDGIAALFAACERTGVRRVVHFSAIGVDRETPTKFSRTKLEGDRRLMVSDLDWIILRPSVVVGRPAYGGSALFRGLASLPILPVMPNTELLQVVQLEDVAETVLFFLSAGAPARLTLDLAGPERLPFTEVVRKYRCWLGWGEPRLVRLPAWVGKCPLSSRRRRGTLGLASAAAIDCPSRGRPGSCRRSARVVAPNRHHTAIAFSGARERACFCAGTLVRRALPVEARGGF